MQNYVDEDVVIRRNSKKRHSSKRSIIDETSKKRNAIKNADTKLPENNDSDFELNIKLNKQIRIISILLFVSSILILLALVSYSPKDQINTEISISDLFRLIGGDTHIIAKYQNTFNWLGIFGALASNALFNYTIGYILLFLPFFMFFWAKELFIDYSISQNLARRTILYLVFATLFASIIGTLQNISWFYEIPLEWSGVVGQFVAAIISGLIGNIGTILLLLALTAITLVFGTEIDIDGLIAKLNLGNRKFVISTKDFINNIKIKFNPLIEKQKVNSDTEEIKDDQQSSQDNSTNEKTNINKREFLPNEKMEPAQIIKRNFNLINTQNSKQPTIINRTNINSPIKKLHNAETFDEVDIDNIPISNIKEIDKYKEVDEIDDTKQLLEKKKNELLSQIQQDAKPKSNSSAINEDKTLELDNNFSLPTFDSDSPENPKKPLLVTVQDDNVIDDVEPINMLSTSIHDQEIKYTPPTPKLLTENLEHIEVNDEELSENARLLREKLETFKIEIDNLSVTPGPVVTQYEFVPAPGIKISRIEGLSDDIAMALKARGIRIIAPIPGKGTVGIEIPNKNPSMVRFSEIVKSARFNNSDNKLPLALGKTIGGEIYCTDLAKMPHLLIAGSTGSGKSVGINTILASLLYKKHPSELKFVIIDPKKVELNQYSLLERHFIATCPDVEDLIITNPEDAVITLKSVCIEMDNRYDILAEAGQRNISDYNKKVASGKYKNNKDMVHRQMPFIVVIIDELADLMLTASKEVEAPIIRIAQLARAVGIHLIVATQRPSVDVITGIIKANFPARIAYLVATKIDSRTILDMGGADQLLGDGDMLFLPGGSPKPIRIQNSFISTDEVEALCEHIGDQKGYSSPYMLPSLIEDSGPGSISAEDRDQLFADAARLVIGLGQGSVSVVQRRLKVGYARAGRIIDELEDAGVVGPYDGSKARIVLMESESDLEAVL